MSKAKVLDPLQRKAQRPGKEGAGVERLVASPLLEVRPFAVSKAEVEMGRERELLGEYFQRRTVAAAPEEGKARIVQRTLTIDNKEQEDELSQEMVPDSDVRNLLNTWRTEGQTDYNFESLAHAIQVATHYHNIQQAATAIKYNKSYIDTNWTNIEELLSQINSAYEDDTFREIQGALSDFKWGITDNVNELGEEDKSIEEDKRYLYFIQGSRFPGRRQDFIHEELQNPIIPEVAQDNPAGLVANAMNSESRVGHLQWVTGNNDFRKWVLDESHEINDDSTMNCWEAIFYSAYKEGLMTRAVIKDLYKDLGKEGDYMIEYIDDEIGPKTSLFNVMSQGGLRRGDIILTTGYIADHVAMSLGGKDVLSLWNKPNDNLRLQRTTLLDLVSKEELSSVSIVRDSPLFKLPN